MAIVTLVNGNRHTSKSATTLPIFSDTIALLRIKDMRNTNSKL